MSSSSWRFFGPPRPSFSKTARDSLLRPERASRGPASLLSKSSRSHSASSSAIGFGTVAAGFSLRCRFRDRSSSALSLCLTASRRFSLSSHLRARSSRFRRSSCSMSQGGSSLYAAPASSNAASCFRDLWFRSHVNDAQMSDRDLPWWRRQSAYAREAHHVQCGRRCIVWNACFGRTVPVGLSRIPTCPPPVSSTW